MISSLIFILLIVIYQICLKFLPRREIVFAIATSLILLFGATVGCISDIDLNIFVVLLLFLLFNGLNYFNNQKLSYLWAFLPLYLFSNNIVLLSVILLFIAIRILKETKLLQNLFLISLGISLVNFFAPNSIDSIVHYSLIVIIYSLISIIKSAMVKDGYSLLTLLLMLLMTKVGATLPFYVHLVSPVALLLLPLLGRTTFRYNQIFTQVIIVFLIILDRSNDNSFLVVFVSLFLMSNLLTNNTPSFIGKIKLPNQINFVSFRIMILLFNIMLILKFTSLTSNHYIALVLALGFFAYYSLRTLCQDERLNKGDVLQYLLTFGFLGYLCI